MRSPATLRSPSSTLTFLPVGAVRARRSCGSHRWPTRALLSTATPYGCQGDIRNFMGLSSPAHGNSKRACERPQRAAFPSTVECGGYMVLGAGLQAADGGRHEMLGLLGLETSFAKRRLHLGYRCARYLERPSTGSAGATLYGHEFHYATVVATPGLAAGGHCRCRRHRRCRPRLPSRIGHRRFLPPHGPRAIGGSALCFKSDALGFRRDRGSTICIGSECCDRRT